MIFVDTSAFFSLANTEDLFHQKAKEILERCLEKKEELVTHNYVLIESFALMHRRLGLATTRLFYKEVHDFCRILWISQSQHERAAKGYTQQQGSSLSFVDCASFEIMRAHGIKRYFAFDQDFQRRGLESA